MLSLIALVGLQSATAFAAACAETPAAAMRLAGAKAAPSSMPDDKGYRVASVRWDPVMQQSWATIVSCGHPEWPGVSLRTDETSDAQRGLSAQARVERSPLVRAGDIVELWRQEDLLRIEVSGVAEQSGSMGETIRVRLLRRQGSNQSVEEQFRGIVHGHADVEMQP
ncbi:MULTISPECIES: flagella basal body P-ring formation protein FlgA [Acidobacteriaceae]|uniref:flagella basal body P-ring formation protein FlgA n=1 Tax=Acidobacteriaceae TaxID=204434 RepID=UPI00131B838B|nr:MULTISPECIES: flagella basal body P-ring formation protein FlgA [Acidobacteriaceae]MDW5266495.1 flagella basal body P-ring formation protein FlgA [Edaphobacter sp.]